MLILQRSAAQQQALAQYLDDVQNPSSPSYHKWLTPAQYGAMFGVSDADLQTVESWLQSYGFKIENVSQAHNLIQFSGTVAQVQSAFQTSIHSFSVLGATHYANVSDPRIPAALAPVVAGVTPLNDFRPMPQIVQGTSGRYDAATHSIQPDLTLFSGNTPLLFMGPADAATIYDTPNTSLNANFTSGTTYDGTGVNIGIVGVSDLTLADVQNYRMAFLGETSSTVNLPTVVVDGDDPGLNGAGVEALLDAEVSGGIAPKAKLYFYTSADTDLTSGLFNAILRAINDNAVSILSMSFGECEAGLGTTGNAFMQEAAQQAAAQGISFVVSAGDGGSAGCDNFDTATQAQYGLAVSGMASTPWTIAVGGTDFDVLPGSFATYANATSNGTAPYYRTALRYIPENPWNDSTRVNTTIANNIRYTNSQGQSNIIAGSGGVSALYGKPAFQSSLTPADNARDLPDVSLFASNGFEDAVWTICSDNVTDGITIQTFTDCQTSGGQLAGGTTIGGAGGTSASAPAFAGMLALVAQAQGGARLGQADTVLYQLAQSRYATVFHDVTVGNNSVPCASGSPNCGSNGFLTGYNAGTGYDLATGLGSVDVRQLISYWASVGLTATSTTLTLNGSAAAYTGVHGASVNFGVGVTPTAATGAVAVIDTANETAGGTASGPQNNGQLSIALSSGAGTASYNGLPGGTYTVSARYGGDTSDASSTSTPISVTIAPEASTTTLQVNAYDALTGHSLTDLTSVPYGSYVFTDAQITGTAEGANTKGVATGSVTFLDGSATLGSAAVSENGNIASWPAQNASFAVLPAGAHSITAKYAGDPSFNSSTSATVAVTVAKDATAMTVTPATVTVDHYGGQSVNLTITTPWNMGAWPSGTVTMTANGNLSLGTANLQISTQGSGTSKQWVLSGQPFIDGFPLPPGNSVVTLTYNGDANYSGSSSTINVYNTSGVGSFTLSNGGDLTLTTGQSGTETVTITPAGGFISVVTFYCAPTGPVSCGYSSANVSGTSPVPASVAVGVPIGAAPGTYPVTVTAMNDTGKITATTTFNVIVTPLPANAGVTITNSGPVTVLPGFGANPILTVTPINGYLGVLNMSCAVTATNGSETVPPTCVVSGSLTISSPSPVYPLALLSGTTSTSSGSYNVTVTVTDESNSSITASTQFPLLVNPTFTLSSSNNITVKAGATTGNTSTITIQPNGFIGSLYLNTTTSGPPGSIAPSCLITNLVAISGTAPASAVLTVTTASTNTGTLGFPLRKFFLAGGGSVLAVTLLFGIPARRRAWRALFSLIAIGVIAAGATSCSGGSSSAGGGGGGGGGSTFATPGTYTVTVTGTDAATGRITSSVVVTVTVT